MSLGDKFEVVSVLDPAIDHARMLDTKFVEYMHTRDISIVRPYFKEDVKPTIFHMREIPQDLWESYIEYGTIEEEKWRRAFLAGLVSIDNLHQRDGILLDKYTPAKRPEKDVAVDEVLQRVSPAERLEIGRVVYTHSFLHPRIKRHFLLPLTCHEQLASFRFLRADANQSSPASSSDAASSPAAEKAASLPIELPPVSTGSPFESHTDATAPEMPNVAVGA